MFDKYLVTGASGFLGRAVLAELIKKEAEIRALVLKNDPLAADLPQEAAVVCGDVCDDASLERFLPAQAARPASFIARVSFRWPLIREIGYIG